MARVVVIGAGVGGLAAAARLAAQGHRVAVHERAATHGGKLGEYRRDGFTFDTGPSLLTLPQVFTDLFAATGGPADLEIEPVDPVCGYRFADGTRLDLPFDPAAVPAALDAALGPGSGAAWQALHDRSARLWDLVGEPVLHRPLRARDLARFSAGLRDLRVVAPWLTVRRLGEQLLPDPRLRMWLDRYATYSGSDPRRAPSVLSVTPYVEQRFGGGGCAAACAAWATRCWSAAGRSASRCTWTPRSPGSRRPGAGCRGSGSPTAGPCPRTSSCPTPTPASSTTGCSPGGVAGRPGRAAPRTGVRGGVRPPARPRRGRCRRPAGAHRIWFPPDYDAEFDALFRRPEPVPDPTVYVHSPADPAMAPAGGEAWFVLVNAPVHDPAGGVDWDAPGLRSATRTGCWRCWRAAVRTSAAGSAGGRSARLPTSNATPRHPAGRSAGPPRTGCWPRCSGRRTGPRCRGSTSSAGRRTREAGCRSSPCPRRSWPTSSGRPERRVRSSCPRGSGG